MHGCTTPNSKFSRMLKKGAGERPGALLLAEQRRGWSLMIFCARATRGLRSALVGRAQWQINQPPSLKGNEQAWKEHLEMCSSDARSKGQPRPLL